MNEEDITVELTHKRELLWTLKRSLEDRQLRVAQFGLNPPISLINEITNYEKQIVECQTAIIRLETIDASEKQDSNNYYNVDGFLQFWVMMAEKHGFEMPVTLTVGGTCISGHISSYEKYIQTIIDVFSEKLLFPGNDNPDDAKEGLLSGLKDILESISEEKLAKTSVDTDGTDKAKLDEARSFRFIHLANGRIWHPGDQLNHQEPGMPWRVKLRDVNGFVFGTPFTG